jgi:choline dehydrogenase-like flavoprotein
LFVELSLINTHAQIFLIIIVTKLAQMGSRIQSQYFQLTPGKAAETVYDIIIVGGGFGGGTLAADLFVNNKQLGDKAKKILVIESGNLVFHSHCLNAARPTVKGNSDMQNDAFFKEFRGEYKKDGSPDWGGGPLHTLGGSTVWGLAIPRPHDDTLKDYFPSTVVNDLNNTFFEMAESTLNISIPTNPKLVHWNLVDELNKTAKNSEAWENGRTASEFKQDKNFTFAAGAYSAVDRLLEIAMNDPEAVGNFKILLGAKVKSLVFLAKSITSVVLEGDINIKTKHVVLCAGSVHSAAILLRSGVNITTPGGGKLTDHDIYKVERTFKYLTPHPTQEEVGSMRLRAYTNLGTAKHAALARITVNSSTLASRSNPTNDPTPKFDMVFILTSKLKDDNTITLDPTSKEPIIHITRSTDHDEPEEKAAMAEMTNNAMKAVAKTLKVKFDNETEIPPTFVPPLPLGIWAHEVGSLPMPGVDTTTPSVLDANLTLLGYTGVSVCDNSVFPYSPSANPSLTLAALALRLSARLLPHTPPAVGLVDIAAGDGQDCVRDDSEGVPVSTVQWEAIRVV